MAIRKVRQIHTFRRDVRAGAALLAAALVLAFGIFSAPGPSALSGEARIVDGDTLRLNGARVRLLGIDAPETGQTCGEADAAWDCGAAARSALARLIGNGPVTCRQSGRDRYGRALAICDVGGDDLGSAIVRAGLAVAEDAYRPEQAEAQAARRGIWSGSFEQPQDWRRDHGALPAGFDAASWLRGWFR